MPPECYCLPISNNSLGYMTPWQENVGLTTSVPGKSLIDGAHVPTAVMLTGQLLGKLHPFSAMRLDFAFGCQDGKLTCQCERVRSWLVMEVHHSNMGIFCLKSACKWTFSRKICIFFLQELLKTLGEESFLQYLGISVMHSESEGSD